MKAVKTVNAPTCLDEPTVGPDGREGGKLRHLQARMDELSAATPAGSPHPSSPARRDSVVTNSSLGTAGDALLQRADAICARNGLPASRAAATVEQREPEPADRALEVTDPAPEPAPVDGRPVHRSCPRCGNSMNPAATLCGYCWLRVAPMGPDGIEPPPLPVRRPWWKF